MELFSETPPLVFSGRFGRNERGANSYSAHDIQNFMVVQLDLSFVSMVVSSLRLGVIKSEASCTAVIY